MSSAVLNTPPKADPNYPSPDSSTLVPHVSLNDVFTSDELQFMESVLWFWEETAPLSRTNPNPEPGDSNPNLDMLNRIRQKLTILRPTT